MSGKAERCADRVRRAPRTPIFSGSQTNAFADLRPTLRQFLTFRRKKTTTQSDTSEELIGRSASRPCLRPVPRTPAAAGPPSARAPHRSLSAAPAPPPPSRHVTRLAAALVYKLPAGTAHARKPHSFTTA